jgi:hypothetical protein
VCVEADRHAHGEGFQPTRIDACLFAQGIES